MDSSSISAGVSINTSRLRIPATENNVNTSVVSNPITMEIAMAFFILFASAEPNARATTMENPLPRLIIKPTMNSNTDAHAPTAASDDVPSRFPTNAVSTAL